MDMSEEPSEICGVDARACAEVVGELPGVAVSLVVLHDQLVEGGGVWWTCDSLSTNMKTFPGSHRSPARLYNSQSFPAVCALCRIEGALCKAGFPPTVLAGDQIDSKFKGAYSGLAIAEASMGSLSASCGLMMPDIEGESLFNALSMLCPPSVVALVVSSLTLV